jgi:hypothetical protein
LRTSASIRARFASTINVPTASDGSNGETSCCLIDTGSVDRADLGGCDQVIACQARNDLAQQQRIAGERPGRCRFLDGRHQAIEHGPTVAHRTLVPEPIGEDTSGSRKKQGANDDTSQQSQPQTALRRRPGRCGDDHGA